MTGESDEVVILLNSGHQNYREYLLAGAARRRPLWLIDDHPPTWQLGHVAGAEVVELLDKVRFIPDEGGLLRAAEQVARTRRVRGIFTYEELLVLTTARIAERLGVPGLTVAGAERCRNKPLTRQTLTEAGLPQPRVRVAGTAAEAARAAEVIGYPVVLKPRGMGASVGVVRADDPAELMAAFEVAERASHSGPVAYEGGVLVEELVEGLEISVDGAVVAGEYFPFCLARKQSGAPPYFEETGHLVDAADPLLRDAELHQVLRSAHRVLGLRDGVTHTEVRLTSRGPVIIEVNARLGGDLIPYLGQLATGVDPGAVAVDAALSRPPELAPGRSGCAGVRFLYPPADCRVTAINVPEPGEVPGLVAAHAMAQPGDALRLPPRAHIARHACVVCTAADPVSCADRLDQAAALVRLSYDALPASELVGSRPW
jgi:biotin carboxylase